MGVDWGPDLRLLTGESFRDEGAVKITCPNHHDTNKSLAIYSSSSFCYGACRRWLGYRDTKALLGGEFDVNTPTYISTPTTPPVDLEDIEAMVQVYHERLFMMHKDGYLTGPKRNLTLETIRRSKIGYNGTAYSIPIYTFDGKFVTIRYRRDPESPGEPKYWGTKGRNQPTLYFPGPWYGRLMWVEGEFDCLIANQVGYSAVTMTNGIGTLPTQEIATTLWEGGTFKIDIVVDNDRASFGRAFQLADTLEQQAPFQTQIYRLPHKDLTEVMAREGEIRLRRMLPPTSDPSNKLIKR